MIDDIRSKGANVLLVILSRHFTKSGREKYTPIFINTDIGAVF